MQPQRQPELTYYDFDVNFDYQQQLHEAMKCRAAVAYNRAATEEYFKSKLDNPEASTHRRGGSGGGRGDGGFANHNHLGITRRGSSPGSAGSSSFPSNSPTDFALFDEHLLPTDTTSSTMSHFSHSPISSTPNSAVTAGAPTAGATAARQPEVPAFSYQGISPVACDVRAQPKTADPERDSGAHGALSAKAAGRHPRLAERRSRSGSTSSSRTRRLPGRLAPRRI